MRVNSVSEIGFRETQEVWVSALRWGLNVLQSSYATKPESTIDPPIISALFMAEPTLEQVFGPGATEDANSITIPKANLPGLTTAANNRAESLFLGIVQLGAEHLTQLAFAANPDQSLVVAYASRDLTTRDGNDHVRHNYFLSAYVPTPINAVTPDDV